jgi:hypothetical protein
VFQVSGRLYALGTRGAQLTAHLRKEFHRCLLLGLGWSAYNGYDADRLDRAIADLDALGGLAEHGLLPFSGHLSQMLATHGDNWKERQ